MARRYSSRSSRTAAPPRIAADGKVDIFCPNCGTRFRLAEEALDSKVQCSVCTNLFLPRTTIGKLARGKDHTMVYAGFAFGALVLVGGLLLLMNRDSAREPDQPAAAAPKAGAGAGVADGERMRRRDQLVKWAQKVAAGEVFLIREYSDLDALCTLLGVDRRLPKDQLDAALLKALKTNLNTRVLYDFDCNSAELPLEAATAGSGRARLFLSPRLGDDVYDRNGRGELAVDFRMDSGQVKVTGCKVVMMPPHRPGR